jgi:hypothetical protein
MNWTTNVGLMGGGSFVEWFGSLEMDNDHDGSWNIGMMEKTFKAVIQSSQAGYPVVLKAAPGPGESAPCAVIGVVIVYPYIQIQLLTYRRVFSTLHLLLPNLSVYMHFERRCATTPPSQCGRSSNNSNFFRVLEWASPEKVSQSADGVRVDVQRKLAETLAPFLIVVEPNVFFSYAWYYNLEVQTVHKYRDCAYLYSSALLIHVHAHVQHHPSMQSETHTFSRKVLTQSLTCSHMFSHPQDGYIPCPEDIECGMPRSWFAEFSKPLGPPDGPAIQNGTIWTRSFQHASVFVDLANRSACKIDWLA